MKKTRTNRFYISIFLTILALAITSLGTTSLAQSGKKPEGTTAGSQKKNNRPDPNKPAPVNPQEAPPDMVGPVNKQDVVTVTSNLVSVDTTVFNKKTKQLVKNLKKEQFAIFEDGVQQTITNFAADEAPITITMVMEYSKLGEWLGFYGELNNTPRGQYPQGKLEVLRPVAGFLTQFIKPPGDYASVIAYDLRPTPITDFTNDPTRLQQTINFLFSNSPAFSDSSLFDALKLALVGGNADSIAMENSKQAKMDYVGMTGVQGRHRAIILVSSGIDTSLSKINYDDARKIEQTAGVPIYIIQTGIQFYDRLGDSAALDPGQWGIIVTGGIRLDRMTFLQAQNAMKTFAKETGGAWYPLHSIEDLPNMLQDINNRLRSQYSLGYNPGDVRDGKQHKIVVRVDVDGDGQFDDKAYEISHRRFYNAPK